MQFVLLVCCSVHREEASETAFAGFQVKGRKPKQSFVFRMHVHSDLHQQARQCWCNPASADSALCLPDEHHFLLRGGVPSVRDWLRLICGRQSAAHRVPSMPWKDRPCGASV